MTQKVKTVFLLFILSSISGLKAFSQTCLAASPQFCESKKPRIGVVCHTAAPGALVYFDLADGSCVYCACSCVASSTPVAAEGSNWVKMGDIKLGDKVLALQKGKWISTEVTYSDGTEGSSTTIRYAIYIALSNGIQLVTTKDHIFLLADKSIKRADRLAPTDNLVDANMKPLKITELFAGDFKGSVHNITVGKPDLQSSNFEGHFINTNGVISGDFYVQSIHKESNDIGLSNPQVGSEEYVLKYKNVLKEERMLGISKTTEEIKFNDKNVFVPYKSIAIPKDAINFLPPKYEKAAIGTLLPLDNSVPYEVAEYIVYNFRRFYPEIIYHIDWTDNVVNAYAWMDGGKRHVALKGGLIRHTAVKQEAVGLVLAHEIGHHFGGGPRYPDNPWASCEGQADYWGALVCERTVWWGPYALQQIRMGGEQLYNLFAYGLLFGNLFEIENQKSMTGICGHPSASCRLATYRAALTLDEKPSCAGDPPSIVNAQNK